MNIEQKTVVLRIMNLVLMKFSLLPCGLKHTPFLYDMSMLRRSYHSGLYIYLTYGANCKKTSTDEQRNYRINIFKYHVFAPMGRFQLKLIYFYFPPSFHLIVGFLSCRPFVVITILSTGLVSVEVTSVS